LIRQRRFFETSYLKTAIEEGKGRCNIATRGTCIELISTRATYNSWGVVDPTQTVNYCISFYYTLDSNQKDKN